jgi:transglutaminase-like putative cysteine protease
VGAVGSWTREVMTYEPATMVSTSALDAWRQGSDRWKDFAYVSLAVLHPIGVPARYVCGYLHPDEMASSLRPVSARAMRKSRFG